MRPYQIKLLELLKTEEINIGEVQGDWAELFVDSTQLSTALVYLKEQFWLQKKDNINSSYSTFLDPFFSHQLKRLDYLKGFVLESGSKKLNLLSKRSLKLSRKIIQQVLSFEKPFQKKFAITCLKEMSEIFLVEEQMQEGLTSAEGHNGPCYYRTFDDLDLLFELDYSLDKNMEIDNSISERLYQGSGVGVQSGYSTILLALSNTEIKKDGVVIDLGSGYGRVGVVCSLLRPDIEFIGYEYVPHRVDVSNKTAENFDLQNKLKYEAQDLSLESFELPDADVYYLYDPFTKETYDYILEKIVEVSRKQEIKIVTKGNARGWLLDIAKANSWPDPILIDEGNLCIFPSK